MTDKRIYFVFLFALLGHPFAESQEKSTSAIEKPLREFAAQQGKLIGTCASSAMLSRDVTYAELLAKEFNVLTAENDMKMHRIYPQRDHFSFAAGDKLVQFAEAHQMKIRGHTLLWHEAVPKWIKDATWGKDELSGIVQNYIKTTVGHFKGKVFAWDAVNEAIDHDASLRKSFWYNSFGTDYIDNAFRWAKEADPDCLLFYNDFDADGLNKKSDAVYELLKGMKQRGVPVDGVGFQLHVEANNYPNIEDMRKNIQRLGALGLQVHFTEIDARIKLPATPALLEQQKKCYQDLMRLCLSEKNCTAFISWGFTDKYSWVYYQFKGFGDALLFDKEFKPKPAYFGVQEVLSKN